jgi:hypothetical protein
MGKVLVCGGKNYDNIPYLCGFLDCFHAQVGISLIIEGGATGADFHARCWAKMHNVQSETVKADWGKHGKAAGPIRNQEMLERWTPDVVIAFPGGRGTADMITRARIKNVPVIRAGGTEGWDGK